MKQVANRPHRHKEQTSKLPAVRDVEWAKWVKDIKKCKSPVI